MNAAISLKAAREMLAAHAPGIVIRKTDCGEYRVTFAQAAIAAAFPEMSRAELIEKAEALACYESDIAEAYESGKAMYRVGLARPAEAAPVLEIEKTERLPAPPVSRPAEAAPVRTIDATPTWAAILPMLRLAIENGTAEGRAIAWEELARMAGAADKWNAAARDFRPLKAETE